MYGFSKFFHRETAFQKPERVLPEGEWPDEWKTTFYKTYKHARRFVLPCPEMPENVFFEDVLRRRKSTRDFRGGGSLDALTISSMLHYGCGLVNSELPQRKERRPYPSAGARYSLEVYPVVSGSKGVPNGVYHYYLPAHELELVRPPGFVDEIKDALSYDWSKNADMFLVVSVVFERTCNKYGERGYRYALEEAGAMTQNIYLACTALGLRVVALAGFEDEHINEIFDFDGVEESVVTLVAIGGN